MKKLFFLSLALLMLLGTLVCVGCSDNYLEVELAEYKAELAKCKEDLSDVKDENATLKMKVDELMADIENLDAECKDLKLERDELKEKNAQLTLENKSHEETVEECMQTLEQITMLLHFEPSEIEEVGEQPG